MPRTPSAFPFSGRLRRRAINLTPPKRVKAWGDGPLRPEVMYPVVEHTRTDCAARNHSRSRAPHHRTQSIAKSAPCLCQSHDSFSKKNVDWMVIWSFFLYIYIYIYILIFVKTSIAVLATFFIILKPWWRFIKAATFKRWLSIIINSSLLDYFFFRHIHPCTYINK